MTKIMLVDDDNTMITLLKTLLEMDGFVVESTSNWHEIVDELAASNCDLLLMDCFLPKIDGLDILVALRADERLASLPVIMTSGMDVEFKAMAAGANAFLLKPYTPDTLYNLLQTITGIDDPKDPPLVDQENN